MKAMGIVRRVDDLGRIVIPKELRRTFGIEIGTPMEILAGDGNVVLRKYNPGCHICGSVDKPYSERNGIRICGDCLKELTN